MDFSISRFQVQVARCLHARLRQGHKNEVLPGLFRSAHPAATARATVVATVGPFGLLGKVVKKGGSRVSSLLSLRFAEYVGDAI